MPTTRLAIANNRSYAAAYNNRAAAWDAQNEFDKAPGGREHCLGLGARATSKPTSAAGAIWYNQGEYDKAVADDNAALAIDPSMAQMPMPTAADAWDLKGEYAKAKADFDQALAIDGNNPDYIDDLAFFQATCLDPQVPRRPAGLRQR